MLLSPAVIFDHTGMLTHDPRDELLIAVRGLMALVTFDNHGKIMGVVRFGAQRYGEDFAVGAEVPVCIWHTVIALESGSVLLELNRGPLIRLNPRI